MSPQAFVITMSLFLFWWMLTVQRSTTSYWWIYSKKSEELACVYTCIFYPLRNKKQFCCLYFCVKVSNELDTEAECDSEEANIALLGLDNQCMAQIPLGKNTLASQLIINSIFLRTDFLFLFFFFHVNWCWAGGGQTESMEPLSDPHVLVEKSALSQLACPSDWCCHSVEQGREVWDSAAGCGSVFKARNPVNL